jgi:hypothetical protein
LVATYSPRIGEIANELHHAVSAFLMQAHLVLKQFDAMQQLIGQATGAGRKGKGKAGGKGRKAAQLAAMQQRAAALGGASPVGDERGPGGLGGFAGLSAPTPPSKDR